MKQTTTLTYNDSRRFQDRWVKLVNAQQNGKCVWTRGIDSIDLPVAHGEGKFFAEKDTLSELIEQDLVVFQYANEHGIPTAKFPQNPNGSYGAIAGICDPSGRVFGLMPHPERYTDPGNHPLASLQRILGRSYIDQTDSEVAKRLKIAGELSSEGAGLQIFRNAVEYAQRNLM